MASHLATDVRLFEDVHRLQEQRSHNVEVRYQLPDFSGARKLVEYRIKIVKGVSDLVDRLLFSLAQTAVIEKRILLEEKTNLFARVEEVIIRETRLLTGRKDRH